MLRAFRLAREALSLLADALQVAGVWVSIGGIGYFGLAATVGLLTNIPWFYIVIGAPAAAFLFVVSTLVWIQLKRPEKPAPAIELAGWGKHPVYTVWAASNLWVGLKPNSQIPADSLAYESLQLIKSHLISGFIQSVYGGTGMTAQVTRDDLIKLANHVGAKPKFLFPN
jgi:hypothetical protein